MQEGGVRVGGVPCHGDNVPTGQTRARGRREASELPRPRRELALCPPPNADMLLRRQSCPARDANWRSRVETGG